MVKENRVDWAVALRGKLDEMRCSGPIFLD
jgi:hypothetical protein